MNEDIKQLIEKECEAQKDIHWNDFGDHTNAASRLHDEAFTKGANFILSKWQDVERWRKVEEELPEASKDCRIEHGIDRRSNPVLIKTKYGGYDVAVYNYYFEDFMANSIAIAGVTHWKPIND